MTLRTALTVALTAAGLAGLTTPAAAQVYIDPVHGTATIGGNYYNPVAGSSTSYYYTPGSGLTYGSSNSVVPGSYTYTTPTAGWYQSGYTYPSTTYTYPTYGTTSGYTYNGYTYPAYTGSSYYPSYSNGYYTPGYVSTTTSYPYTVYNTARRWFRR